MGRFCLEGWGEVCEFVFLVSFYGDVDIFGVRRSIV